MLFYNLVHPVPPNQSSVSFSGKGRNRERGKVMLPFENPMASQTAKKLKFNCNQGSANVSFKRWHSRRGLKDV